MRIILKQVQIIAILMYIVYFAQKSNGEGTIFEGSTTPRFISKPRTFKVVSGENVILPCEVGNLGSSVLVWRKGPTLISAGHHLITSDKRYLLQFYNLQLKNVNVSDEGDYTCQIGDGSLGDLIHSVQILIPPSLQIIPPESLVTSKHGGSVLFECQAHGNPVPIVQWSKKNGILPSGLQVESGYSLSINSVQKEHAGTYQCTASNGIGQPATAEVKLHVLYSPHVEIFCTWRNLADNLEAKLNCKIDADPPAELTWYQDSFPLQPTDRRIISTIGSTYTLTIKKVQLSDFGNYSCVVTNSVGRERKFIEISGRPGVAHIVSPGYSNPDNYVLRWTVQSVFPILEARILYRRLLMNTTYHHHQQWHDVFLVPTEVSFNEDTSERLMQYHLKNLEPDSIYECLIQTKSKYGYSELSHLHQWFTSIVGRHVVDLSSDSISIIKNCYNFNSIVYIVSYYLITVFSL